MEPTEPVRGELVRIMTKDGLELNGLLFEPANKTGNALVHVHAWIGNFYENAFIDPIAQEAVKRGLAFLTFNNRGCGIVTDIRRRENGGVEYARIGGCLENFEECVLDVSAAIEFLGTKGYGNIVLEGHSTGCQKITYYKFKSGDARVKGLVELSPADDVAVVKRLLGPKYEKAIGIAKKMASGGNGRDSVPAWMQFYPMLSSKTFLSVADPASASGKIFDYSGELHEIKNAGCPVLVAFGSNDEYEPGSKDKLEILEKCVKNCSTHLFDGADHWFSGQEGNLAKIIGEWTLREAFK